MTRHWLLWDGDCGLCAAAAAWVKRRDGAGQFHVVAWQEAPSPPMTSALAATCAQAVQVLADDGTLHGGERAVLFVLGALVWPRLARWGVRPPLRWLLAGGYRWVAGHRHCLGRLLGYSLGCGGFAGAR